MAAVWRGFHKGEFEVGYECRGRGRGALDVASLRVRLARLELLSAAGVARNQMPFFCADKRGPLISTTTSRNGPLCVNRAREQIHQIALL